MLIQASQQLAKRAGQLPVESSGSRWEQESKACKLLGTLLHYLQDELIRTYMGVWCRRGLSLKKPHGRLQSATHLATVEVGREMPVAVIAKPRRASFGVMSSL